MCTDLCVEAAVGESEDEACEDGEVLVGGDVCGVRGLGLAQVWVEGEVEEHEEVAEHAEHEARDDDRVPPSLGSQVTQEPEERSAWHLETSIFIWFS